MKYLFTILSLSTFSLLSAVEAKGSLELESNVKERLVKLYQEEHKAGLALDSLEQECLIKKGSFSAKVKQAEINYERIKNALEQEMEGLEAKGYDRGALEVLLIDAYSNA